MERIKAFHEDINLKNQFRFVILKKSHFRRIFFTDQAARRTMNTICHTITF